MRYALERLNFVPAKKKIYLDYQMQKEVLSILNCLYLIEKNLAKNKIVSIINAQSMLSQNVERQRVNSTLQ